MFLGYFGYFVRFQFVFLWELITDLEVSLCRLTGLVIRLLTFNPFLSSLAMSIAVISESLLVHHGSKNMLIFLFHGIWNNRVVSSEWSPTWKDPSDNIRESLGVQIPLKLCTTAEKAGWAQVPVNADPYFTMGTGHKVDSLHNQNVFQRENADCLQRTELSFMQYSWWGYQDPGLN